LLNLLTCFCFSLKTREMAYEEELFSDDVIYHYTSLTAAFECILPYGKLRFSCLENTNDPLEYKTLFINASLWADNLDKQRDLMYDTIGLIGKTRKSGYQAACFCRNESDNDLRNTFDAIKSLGCAKSRMWSQYGDNHKGVVLAFSKTKFLKEIQKSNYDCLVVLSGDVQYNGFDFNYFPAINGNRILEIGQKTYCREFLKENQEQLFFTKDKDYRDENEFRVVLATETNKRIHVDITSSLQGLIIGDRFPDGFLPNLKFFAEKYQVNCRRLWYEKGVPSLLWCKPHSDEVLGDFEIPEF